MEFSYKPPEDDKGGGRSTFRARVPGLDARVVELSAAFPVTDVSAGGFAVESDGKPFSLGMKITIDLLIKQQAYITGLAAVVRRIIPDRLTVGCSFEPMDRRQEARLDKLVLEVQKRMIDLRKARKEKEKA